MLDFFPYPESKDGACKIVGNILNRISDEFEVTIICTSDEVGTGMPERHTFHSEPMMASPGTRRQNKFAFVPSDALSMKQIDILMETYQLHEFDVIHTALHSFARIATVHPNVFYGLNDSLSRSCLDGTFKGRLKAIYQRRVEKKISKMKSRVIVVSERDASFYEKERTLVLPNGVDDSTFYPTQQSKIENSFVFHGVLDYQVNVDAITEMSKTLKQLSPDYSLYLVGRMNRPGQETLKKYFKDLGNCHLVGEVDDVSMEITKYQFYLALMNSGAGLKNKLLEAMCSEMVVLANERALEGMSNRAEILKAVYLIETPEDITAAMNQQDEWTDHGRNGRIYVQDYYTWQRYLQQLESAYKSTLPS